MARLKLSIVLDSGARVGPGKAALLESIRDTGSISAAARSMEMSYKRAWLLLDRALVHGYAKSLKTQQISRTAVCPKPLISLGFRHIHAPAPQIRAFR